MSNNTYNFQTIEGDTTNPKEFKIEEAQSDWELEFKIYNPFGELIEKWNTLNSRLERLNSQTWRLKKYKEINKAGIYTYSLCYIKSGNEYFILKGKIIIKKHN